MKCALGAGMLDLSKASRRLDSFHQHFLDDGFPRELSRDAFAAFEGGGYSDVALRRGRSAWQLRALDEYRSMVAFTELLAELGVAKLLEGTPTEIGLTVHAHPSLSEAVKEAALAVSNEAIHI